VFLPAIVQRKAAFTFTKAFGMMRASVPRETPAVAGGCFAARGCSVRGMRSVSSLRRDVDFAGVFVAVDTERTHTLLFFFSFFFAAVRTGKMRTLLGFSLPFWLEKTPHILLRFLLPSRLGEKADIAMVFVAVTTGEQQQHTQIMPSRQKSPLEVHTSPSRIIKKWVELQVATKPWGTFRQG